MIWVTSRTFAPFSLNFLISQVQRSWPEQNSSFYLVILYWVRLGIMASSLSLPGLQVHLKALPLPELSFVIDPRPFHLWRSCITFNIPLQTIGICLALFGRRASRLCCMPSSGLLFLLFNCCVECRRMYFGTHAFLCSLRTLISFSTVILCLHIKPIDM